MDFLCSCYWEFGNKAPSPRRAIRGWELERHMFFGWLNTKSYYLVLFLLIVRTGTTIDAGVLLLDGIPYLSLTPAFARWFSRGTLHWAALFYHQHRVAHVPHVYCEAHRMHHRLHSTTAFDAHVYGSGLPEEWALLLTEAAFALYLGAPPFTFNAAVIEQSWWNKRAHSWTRGDRDGAADGGQNNHARHHTLHTKNFGIFNIGLDLAFGTAADGADVRAYRKWAIARLETGKGRNALVTLRFSEREAGGGGGAQRGAGEGDAATDGGRATSDEPVRTVVSDNDPNANPEIVGETHHIVGSLWIGGFVTMMMYVGGSKHWALAAGSLSVAVAFVRYYLLRLQKQRGDAARPVVVAVAWVVAVICAVLLVKFGWAPHFS